AARYAAEFNVPFSSVEETRELFARVDRVCDEHGRDPLSLVHSAAQVLCVGRDDATVRRRAAAIGRDAAELRANGLAGTPEEVRDRAGRLAEAGASRLYLQVLDLHDLDHLADAHAALTG
ncbi:MAG: LLM class F420-dependent oxidoreductase, partial [Micrococcales bacterium]|nr:LLM class F420-dependent oxidoreductase [Micrococcales bacterium]